MNYVSLFFPLHTLHIDIVFSFPFLQWSYIAILVKLILYINTLLWLCNSIFSWDSSKLWLLFLSCTLLFSLELGFHLLHFFYMFNYHSTPSSIFVYLFSRVFWKTHLFSFHFKLHFSFVKALPCNLGKLNDSNINSILFLVLVAWSLISVDVNDVLFLLLVFLFAA